jgi:hypothetical protein
MKSSLQKTAVKVIFFVALLENDVFAHDQAAALTATGGGNGSGATDIYHVKCFNDPALSQNPTDHLYLQIRDDSSAGGQVSAVATIQNRAVSVTDIASGGAVSTGQILI